MTDYIYENITVDIQDGIAWTALNRPEKKNAMSPDLHYDMDDALGRLETDPAVKVVVIMGAGGNFSSGQDLKKFFLKFPRGSDCDNSNVMESRWRNDTEPTIVR